MALQAYIFVKNDRYCIISLRESRGRGLAGLPYIYDSHIYYDGSEDNGYIELGKMVCDHFFSLETGTGHRPKTQTRISKSDPRISKWL